jgi:hydroxymethylpyrimidine/phosphomethylpyrimidine kinase
MTRPLLLIGGIDSGGGAGLLRDQATALSMGLTARIVVTALTAQNDAGVRRVNLSDPAMIAAQIAAAREAGPIGAVKIGMLGDAAIVRAVARALPDCPIVLDPVLASSSGHPLMDAKGLAALHTLLRRATVVTPNLPELASLTARPAVPSAAEAGPLAATLPCAVLVKDGHGLGGYSTDLLFRPGLPPLPLTAPRQAQGRRGTGCTLATALAAGLAQGLLLDQAAAQAKTVVTAYLQQGMA